MSHASTTPNSPFESGHEGLTDLSEGPSRAGKSRRKILILCCVAAVLVLSMGMIAAASRLMEEAPTWTVVSVEVATQELPPDTAITVTLSRVGVGVADVVLHETKRGAGGEIASERSIPVELVPTGDGSLFDVMSEFRLQAAEGSSVLEYDGLYRLSVAFKVRSPAFPFPEEVLATRDYGFSTLETPRLREPEGVVHLAYRQPLELQWYSPIERFGVEITPQVRARSWVDPIRRDVAYLDLNGAEPGARYQIQVVEATGTNGAPLVSAAALTVETAGHPIPVLDTARLVGGDLVAFRWDRSVAAFEYEITPPVDSVAQVDLTDGQQGHIMLRGAEQQQEYQVRITGGVSPAGAPVLGSYRFAVVTPPPLEISGFSPHRWAYGVRLDSPIDITFGEPIRDRAAAEAAVSITPAIPGVFEWLAPNHLRFIAEGRLPDLEQITVRVEAGHEGARGESGGYLDSPLEFTFLTQPDKLILVDLSSQVLTLLESDRPVFSTAVSTGVRGADTPTGLYMVNFKAPYTRMRGVNPDGSRYDIPNVPAVLAFLGDYTIHAAPWRARFGFPQSNGCVSMETGAAWRVYEWAPIGTPVRIHY